MFNDTITIFNRYHNRNGDVFYPHTINNVYAQMDKSSIMARYGSTASDNAIIHIPYTSNGGKLIEGIPYLPPKEWARLTNDTLKDYITFNDGQYFDFLIVGELPEEFKGKTEIIDNDYLDGLYNYINTRCDYVFSVTSVSFFKSIPHFEILAK